MLKIDSEVMMKFLGNIKINSKIEVINGLHIGAGNETLEIGGLDNPVIRNPKTREPYIPGSSLKGKMRFLTEWAKGELNEDDITKVHSCKRADCSVCRIFGTLDKVNDNNKQRGITRLIVRDATLDGKFRPEEMLEIKYSTAIDRSTGAALGKSLRNIERVVPGVMFSSEFIYRVFDLDDNGEIDMKNFRTVVEAMKLLENDTLGGSGSRGCGKIAFRYIKVDGELYSGEYKSVDELLSAIDSGEIK